MSEFDERGAALAKEAGDKADAIGMAASNAAQRQRFANNPVIPNQPAQLGDTMGGAVLGQYPEDNRPAATPSFDYAKSFAGGSGAGVIEQAASQAPSLTVNQNTASPRMDGSADSQAARAGLSRTGEEAATPISYAVSSPDSIRAAQAGTVPGMTTEQANAYYGAQNRISAARDLENSRYNMQVRNAADESARRPTGWEVDKAKREADMAAFDAKHGADMVLRGGNKEQRQAILANAERAANRAGIVEAAYRGAPNTAQPAAPQNTVLGAAAQNQAGQNVIQSSIDQQKASLGLAAGRQGLASGQLDMKQKEAHTKAFSDMLSATDPAARAKAQSALLALHGKTGQGWQVHTVKGPVDPLTGSAGEALFMYNPETKEGQYIQNPATAQSAAKAPPQIGEIRDGHKFKGGNPGDQANWTKV